MSTKDRINKIWEEFWITIEEETFVEIDCPVTWPWTFVYRLSNWYGIYFDQVNDDFDELILKEFKKMKVII